MEITMFYFGCLTCGENGILYNLAEKKGFTILPHEIRGGEDVLNELSTEGLPCFTDGKIFSKNINDFGGKK